MKNCTCRICTTSVADLLTEVFMSFLLGYITIDEYDKMKNELKAAAKKQTKHYNYDKCWQSTCTL